MKGSFIKNLHRAFATGLLLLIISSAASYFVIHESYSRAEWVRHTELVKGKLEALLSNIQDAETSVRGYLLTGNNVTLGSYRGSYSRSLKSLNEIKDLTNDNKEQQKTLPLLKSEIDRRYQLLDQHLDLQEQKHSTNKELILKGTASMKNIHRFILQMQAREEKLLERRDILWDSYRTFSPLLIILITITGTVSTYYFCSKLKTAYYRNVRLQKVLQEEKIETDKRIKLIHDIADQVAEGNYNLRLQEKESDVLGNLTVSLNRMTSSLEYSFNALKELMVKKDDFISIAAHELKTPLTSIKAYLQFMGRMKLETEEGRKIYPFVSKANTQVNRLTLIIKDLLDVARINENQLPLQLETFSVREAILEVSEEIFNSVRTHELIIEGEPDVFIKADKFRIEQVLINLISNAIKYSPNKNRIIAKVEKDDDFVRISIKDFGIGIAKEKLPYIFERYFRVEQTSQNFAGMGLGLYISNGIIKRHGGQMGAASQLGEGTVIWVKLPALIEE